MTRNGNGVPQHWRDGAHPQTPVDRTTMGDNFRESGHPDVREALYRENARARLDPPRLGPDAIERGTSVAVLGLEQGTISRLYRCSILQLQDLLTHPVEDLWRKVGRHGIADILARLELLGIDILPLNDQARWRLGLMSRDAAITPLDADTPVAQLWPRLGVPLVDALQKRNLLLLKELAPESDDAVLQLYRLGRANLRRIRELLEGSLESAQDPDRARIAEGIGRIREREMAGRRTVHAPSTQETRPRPVRRHGDDSRPEGGRPRGGSTGSPP